MEPITLAQMSQDNSDHVYVAFKYSRPVSGYDHALILICEQDYEKDSWRLVETEILVDGFPVRSLDFENVSFPGGRGTLGPEDDIGHRKHLIRANPGNVWTAFRQRFNPRQPDAADALEFYAVIAIVSVAGGVPVAHLGDITITPTLRMRKASAYERRVAQFRDRYRKSSEWFDWMMDHQYRYRDGAFLNSQSLPSQIDIAFRYYEEPLHYDPPWSSEAEHMNALRTLAEAMFEGYRFNFIFNGNTESSYANIIAAIPAEGTLADGTPYATSHASGKNMFLWYETIFAHEFGHIMGLPHHYDSIETMGDGLIMPPGDTRCEMDKTGPLFCSGCATALNIPLDADNSEAIRDAMTEIKRRYPY